ncbi:2Fe-2S iron-sulfur cluster-binding protein [Myxococcota bacterium]|nr:2Fe-2S iron-sulfur cluster-binding protein [Myxococcota bacterium]
MSEIKTVTLTIDGRQVTVPAGTSVLEASKVIGAEVPHFCYHPGLPVDGNCRMCIVEIDGARRPPVSCATSCADGMVVRTDTAAVKAIRASVMEFLLVNHPIDCPICDKAGECMLQDYYMQHDRKRSELRDEKVHKPRLVKFSDRIVFNGERCILCTRCVRFTENVTRTHELGIVNRGDRALVEVAGGGSLHNRYQDNVADICPVGALTKTDFRFKKRVWFLKHTDSICPGCSRGCNVVLDHDKNEVVRVMPRFRAEVNGHWMCDEGRDIHKRIGVDRLLAPRVKLPGREGGATPEEALEAVAEVLGEARKTPDRLAAIASSWGTNEEAFLFAKLFGETLRTPHMDVKSDSDEGYPEDDVLHTADHNPNRAGVVAQGVVPNDKKGGLGLAGILDACRRGDIQCLVVWGPGLSGHLPGGESELALVLSKVARVVYLGWKDDPVARLAHVALPTPAWAEKDGSYTNCDGIKSTSVRALDPPPGVRGEIEVLADLQARLKGRSYGRTFRELAAKTGAPLPPRRPAPALRQPSLYRHASGVARP